MSTAKKAVVLAAGLGTRLRPLTCAVPKPLLPVWGEPMLNRIVDMLRSWGVDDIVVNAHYLADAVGAWAKTVEGVKVTVSREDKILGTGGVLNPLRDWIGDESFYLVNGDIVVEDVPKLVFEKAGELGTVATCLVTEEGPRTIEVEPEYGVVTNWRSDDAGYEGTYTYAGIALLTPEILKYVPPSGFSSIVSAYEKAMTDGLFVKAVKASDMLWTDAGTVDRYIDLNRAGEDNAFHLIPQLRAAGVTKAEFLGARGSNRVFFRTDRGIAIVYDDSERHENALYAGHARWLGEHGAPVPAVVFDDPAAKTVVLEDVGSVDLLKRVEKAGPKAVESYVPVVEALAAFGSLDPAGLKLMPKMDADTWKWECDLFFEHCLRGRFNLDWPEGVEAEYEKVSALLCSEPLALVHRDFQSTNVMWKGDAFKFIDFQGMRLGPAVYDLASLLYDPYVKLTEGERRALAALFGKRTGRPEVVKVLPLAAVQRLSQALGAYGRLASVGHPEFSKHVLPALENLLSAADEAGLDAIGGMAEDLIAREMKAHGHGDRCACGHHHEHGHVCTCGHHHHE